MLTAADHSRLIRTLELVRRSESDGEVLAAAYAARRILGDRSFADVWPAPPFPLPGTEKRASSTKRQPSTGPVRMAWYRVATACLAYPDLLSEWEQRFLTGLLRCGGQTISPKQAAVVEQIADKVAQLADMSF